ncbi:UNVERIFIED_CONTAM: Non-specific phospholipase C1 [Sesamum radiatum]|uniref:Non-specific phospholipase C1 n=1 Tax=Sesamum radiatum TaxID=300843 RepID=A0AAW2IVQ2_SESRA
MGSFRRTHLLIFVFIYLLLFPSVSRSFPFPRKPKHEIQGPIKTFVVLVMENRSFDHILGWLKRTRPDIDGLSGGEFNRVNASDPTSPAVSVSDDAFLLTPTRATLSKPSGNRYLDATIRRRTRLR